MTVGELLTHGGWAMAPIYLCSIVALMIFVRKALDFRAQRLGDLSWFESVLGALEAAKISEARQRAEQASHPVGRVIVAMLAVAERRPDRVEAEAQRAGSLELQHLERNLGALSFIAQVAPLLGLLGTVFGMVELFMGLQGTGATSVDAALLASGIWKALLTTAAGLVVAVPALAAYSYLNSRTDSFRLVLRDSIERVLTTLPAAGQAEDEVCSEPKLLREAADAI